MRIVWQGMLLLVLGLWCPAIAHGQRAIDIQSLRLSGAPEPLLNVEGAHPRAHLEFATALAGHYARNPFVLVTRGNARELVVQNLAQTDLLFALGLFGRLEIDLAMPFVPRIDIVQPGPGGDPARGGIGDVRLQVKALLASGRGGETSWAIALAAMIGFPTGDGRSFLGEETLTLFPRLLIDVMHGIAFASFNLGYRLRSDDTFANLKATDEIAYGAGAGVSILDRHLDLFAEGWGFTSAVTPFKEVNQNTTELLAGLRYHLTPEIAITVAGGAGIQRGYGGPEARGVLVFSYYSRRTDRDEDGVRDVIDACPDTRGPPENNGCPWPDKDADGTPDIRDACPDKPGPTDNAGCPRPKVAKCPECPEAPTCPVAKACPECPAPRECPDCPVCPKPKEELRIAVGKIFFAFGTAKLLPKSYAALDALARDLLRNATVTGRIEGHTDSIGRRDFNLKLSRARAKSVLRYLAAKGIDEKRIESHGFGPDKPLVSNRTAAGRARNRRVEFVLTGGLPGTLPIAPAELQPEEP